MLDMTMEDKDKKYFITDIEHIDDILRVTRADGTVEEEIFSNHNLGVYRHRMIESAKDSINPFMDELSKDSFFTFVKRYAAIIGGIVSLFFLYNVDIHVIMKIILTILIVLGELGYYLYNQLYLMIIGDQVIECLATEYYLKNLNKFNYFDREHFTDGYIVPPEDISKYKLTQDSLEQIVQTIEDFKKQGFESDEISLSYKRQSVNPKSVI